jgi:hypothetical protein
MASMMGTLCRPKEMTLLHAFYTTPRAGAVGLSDGGGPFGFDITVALQVDFLIREYECDAVVETGCFLGDTTEYLARQYPYLPVTTCDIAPEYASFTRHRLRAHSNATVVTGSSAEVLPEAVARHKRPLIYLDAHWYDYWPLRNELSTITRGVVCIDDFDIGHPRFAYDEYAGKRCDADLVRSALPDQEEIFVGNPLAVYAFPCLQVGRRSGVAYLTRELAPTVLATAPMFVALPLHPMVRIPNWSKVELERSSC